MRCVVFGATGYIGGRLVPELLRAGHQVRVVARTPAKLNGAPWQDRVEVMRGDVTAEANVHAAVAGQQIVYYLVHSLTRRDFADVDQRAARTVAAAARSAGVGRIVYLGGIVPDQTSLSRHLASRAEVGAILRESGVPTAELRAAVIIGSGSASFEMLRYLSERLPAMVTPRWVHNRIQPIAVRDVLHYLVRSADLPVDVSRSFDIGGPDVMTYLTMMRQYAAVAGLPRRIMLPVPVLTPWLSAQWVNIVTPVPRALAVPLIESLVHEVICHDHDIADYIPAPEGGPTTYERAVELALARIRNADVPTRWSDADTARAPSDPLPTDPDWSGGSLYEDLREQHTTADPETLWAVIESIGGENGWYSFPLAWSLRGWIDRLSGGVGLRRRRKHPHRLHPGEALDWWRVEHIERPRSLRLRAEMQVPGSAWLELGVEPEPDGGARYRQRAVFQPRGLAGHLYWKAITPFHDVVFGGMVRNIIGTAEQRAAASEGARRR
ncbi:SDR family oxidoreductase [Nocardia cyriacigeorgica]|uniref:SDR family oxidoreductase n=1 Tax=Nocardia cyriacigeorgica TaxID=135487 RepID=UPI001893B2AF|nr:SDR family oxidoreductase [Nocardia cyriacigeorgica]MBF6454714.1 SDR family oxidoreductase [Nocardia cyriacigeorgica]MBF6480207.1 SDR family oxidoreductase [Nocardia cyriacigeorgica]MBF6552608.1 SDR family oxidoreductase [Nocardia cyriacigeorgica]